MGPEIYYAIWRGSYQSHDVCPSLPSVFLIDDLTSSSSWGESAGAISASLHMLAEGDNTEGLFRAAFMESGAPIPVGDVTKGQVYYDNVVSDRFHVLN